MHKKNGLDDKKRELKLMEAAGKSEAEIHKQRKAIHDAELFNLYYRKQRLKDFPEEVAKLEAEIKNKWNDIKAENIAFNKKQEERKNTVLEKRKVC